MSAEPVLSYTGPVEFIERLTGNVVLIRSAGCGRQQWRLQQLRLARRCVECNTMFEKGKWLYRPSGHLDNRHEAICMPCIERLLHAPPVAGS